MSEFRKDEFPIDEVSMNSEDSNVIYYVLSVDPLDYSYDELTEY